MRKFNFQSLVCVLEKRLTSPIFSTYLFISIFFHLAFASAKQLQQFRRTDVAAHPIPRQVSL